MADAKSLPTKAIFELSGHQDAVRAVRFNKNGEYCLTCSADRTVRLWNPHRGLGIKTYKGPGQEVLDADAADRTVRLWNPHRGLGIKTYKGPGQEVLDADASHDNGRIACGGADKQVLLIDVSTGHSIRKFRGHHSRINCVKFNDESSLIISGSYDASVRVWDCRAKTFEPVQIMNEAKDSVTSLFISLHEIVTGSVDGKVRRYDIRFGKLFTDTVGQPVTSVSLTQDGHCVLVSSLDNKIRLFDNKNGELLNTYTGHSGADYKIDSSFTFDDTSVVSGSEDGKIYFWDLVESKIIQTLDHGGTISSSSSNMKGPCITYSLAYHPSTHCLLTAGSYGPVKVWSNTEEQD